MPHTTKIATCCYCGTRAALVLRGEVRHELACSSCGAPLHDLKMLPGPEATHGATSKTGIPAARRVRYPTAASPARPTPERPVKGKRKKVKKRKGLGRRFLEEAFDALEDIFD